MFESLHIKHLGYWFVAIAIIGLLVLGRKSVKTSICSFHKFGFCDAGQARIAGNSPFYVPLTPDTSGVNITTLNQQALDTAYNPECYEGAKEYNLAKCNAKRQGLKPGHGG